ncbi:MAG TPA: site-2 protease family protein [Syntrophorhabdales bacterium]|nr:site-2 protease family protein [Syntrophorhabdales bacterium]
MFGRKITLFKLLGFTVRADVSWLVLAFLITWSLAVGVFPLYYKGLSQQAYWWMGVFGALGLFGSIVFHEMCHSLVARKYGLPIKGITLFIFGGVAEMEDEPQNPKTEFLMAAAGPASSVLLALIFHALSTVTKGTWPIVVNGVISYLGWINGTLAIFNLLPAFPLDGGRVLRSALWSYKGDLNWATRVASRIGSGFGFGMIFLGILSLLRGNFIGGVWWFVIGMFLRNASQMSYQQLVLRKSLEGVRVARFMKRDPITVSLSTSIEELVKNYIYHYHFKMYPVVEGTHLKGVVTIRRVKQIPPEEWPARTVGEIAEECTTDNTIGPEADATKALEQMNRMGVSRLLVVDHGKLVGIITLKDMLTFLSLRVDLQA